MGERMSLSQRTGVGIDDPLASWNDGPTKKSIVDFVDLVTNAGGKDYVTPEERIATFDNDGTLWSERPYPFQIAFALDKLRLWHRSTRSGRTRSPLNLC